MNLKFWHILTVNEPEQKHKEFLRDWNFHPVSIGKLSNFRKTAITIPTNDYFLLGRYRCRTINIVRERGKEHLSTFLRFQKPILPFNLINLLILPRIRALLFSPEKILETNEKFGKASCRSHYSDLGGFIRFHTLKFDMKICDVGRNSWGSAMRSCF